MSRSRELTLVEAESLLRSEIEGALAEGWRMSERRGAPLARQPRPMIEMIGPGSCCAIGAAVRHSLFSDEDEGWSASAMVDLEPLLDVDAVGEGWDGTSWDAFQGRDRSWWDLGDRLAQEYAGLWPWPERP
jgi:hypothetical protein